MLIEIKRVVCGFGSKWPESWPPPECDLPIVYHFKFHDIPETILVCEKHAKEISHLDDLETIHVFTGSCLNRQCFD
jgi:hypothetical protein